MLLGCGGRGDQSGEVMPPTPLAPPMRRPGGPPGLLSAGWEACRPFSPTSLCPEATSLASSSFPPSSLPPDAEPPAPC